MRIRSFLPPVDADDGAALVEFALITALFSMVVWPAFLYLNAALGSTASKQVSGYPLSVANPAWTGKVQRGLGGQYCDSQIVVSCP